MKKTITISKINNEYQITCGIDVITTLKKPNLSLSGQDLYVNLFDKFPLDQKVELEIEIDTNSLENEDKYIVGEIKKVVTEITDEINYIIERNNKK